MLFWPVKVYILRLRRKWKYLLGEAINRLSSSRHNCIEPRKYQESSWHVFKNINEERIFLQNFRKHNTSVRIHQVLLIVLEQNWNNLITVYFDNALPSFSDTCIKLVHVTACLCLLLCLAMKIGQSPYFGIVRTSWSNFFFFHSCFLSLLWCFSSLSYVVRALKVKCFVWIFLVTKTSFLNWLRSVDSRVRELVDLNVTGVLSIFVGEAHLWKQFSTIDKTTTK